MSTVVLLFAASLSAIVSATCDPKAKVNITGTIYADNWFKFWFNGELIIEDPIDFIPHQAVEVTFEAPQCGEYLFAFEAKDYSDDVTGLEYGNNCVGDGGFKAMFSDGTVTNKEWKVFTYQYGPINATECLYGYPSLQSYYFAPAQCKANTNETLKGNNCEVEYFNYSMTWNQPETDFEKEMDAATEFTDDFVGFGVVPSAYGPYTPCNQTGLCCIADGGSTLCPGKDVDWSMYGKNATFIWGPDLNFDNRVLFRYKYQRGAETTQEPQTTEDVFVSTKVTEDVDESKAMGHASLYHLIIVVLFVMLYV